MTEAGKESGKPIIQYRVELEKRIEINKSFSERRNQAVAMRILSYGLFGQKRYQNLYLNCSLNCFHLALKIANQIHQRVAGLAMIIKFDTVQVLEYFAKEFNGKYFEEKKYSKIVIKLTKNPTEEDKKEPGFVPGLQADQVEEPLTQVLARKKRSGGNGGQRMRQQQRQPHNTQKDKGHPQKNHNKEKQEEKPKKKEYRESRSEQVKSYKEKENKNTNKSTANTSRKQQYKPKETGDRQKRNYQKDQGRGSRKPRNRYEEDDD